MLAYKQGFEVILAPTTPTDDNWKAAGATAKKVPAAPAKYVKVVDVDNDGYLDIVVAGGMVSYSPDLNKVIIYFGSGQTKASCDYSAARCGCRPAMRISSRPARSWHLTWPTWTWTWRHRGVLREDPQARLLWQGIVYGEHSCLRWRPRQS